MNLYDLRAPSGSANSSGEGSPLRFDHFIMFMFKNHMKTYHFLKWNESERNTFIQKNMKIYHFLICIH